MERKTLMGSWVVRIVVLGFVVILAGCTTLRIPKGVPPHFHKMAALQREKRLAHLTHWGIEGAFSIRQGKRAHIANYVWQQLGKKAYRIRISSALNLYHILILGRLGSVTLWRSETDHMTAKSPEGLMLHTVGWALPISSLYYWIRGLPAPGKSELKFDLYGHLVWLHQHGWTLQYRRYTNVDRYDLPRVFYLRRPGYRVKIVIKHWMLHNQHLVIPKYS